MNLFGNAQKYTSSGFILVQLRTKEVEKRSGASNGVARQRMLVLNIIDSGRGMSSEYMERKLYTPFAQEDSFATGVGLGLSIV
jgi:signal transduction histidine kinase